MVVFEFLVIVIHMGITRISNKTDRIGHTMQVVQYKDIELTGGYRTIVNGADKVVNITLKVFYVGGKSFGAFLAGFESFVVLYGKVVYDLTIELIYRLYRLCDIL